MNKTRSCAEVAKVIRSPPEVDTVDQSSGSEEDFELASEGASEEEISTNNSESEAEEESLKHSENSDLETEAEPAIKKRMTGDKECPAHLPKTVYGKNRYKWTTECPKTIGGRSVDRIISHLPAGKDAAATVRTPLEAWSLLMPDELLELVVTCTNAEISRRRDGGSLNESCTHDVDLLELKAFIGLLYFSGVYDNSHNSLSRLWGGRGSAVYRATMPLNRFAFLLQTLRFDDERTRLERRQTDKLTAIREIWEMFIANCKKYYTPHQYCTINEQLVSFRGRCPFRTYLRTKPDKSGMKIVMMNDAKTSYMINAIPHLGSVERSESSESVPSYYIRTLSEPIHGSGRNITTDERFSSIPIFDQMKDLHALTMVGAIRKNKPEIPEALKINSYIGTVEWAYSNDKTLLSHCPEKNKIVLLLSSLHKAGKFDTSTGKPEMMNFYKSTKGGTDTFDQLCHEYSVGRDTRRWPVRFFYAMLDQCGVNCYVLFLLNAENQTLQRSDFLEELSIELVKPLLMKHLEVRTLRTEIRGLIKTVLNIEASVYKRSDLRLSMFNDVGIRLDRRTRCAFCPREKDIKTQVACPECRMPRCDKHRSMMCVKCADEK